MSAVPKGITSVDPKMSEWGNLARDGPPKVVASEIGEAQGEFDTHNRKVVSIFISLIASILRKSLRF